MTAIISTEIATMLSDGDADIGICTETLRDVPTLTTFPFYSWHHGVIVPKGHALATVRPLTLEAIAEWPIITYHEGFTGRGTIDQTFAAAGLAPDVVMSAMDTDVLKAYVELGLGVGIIDRGVETFVPVTLRVDADLVALLAADRARRTNDAVVQRGRT